MRYAGVLLTILLIGAFIPSARAEIDSQRLADAIGKAENSWHYKPYGVLKDYCKPYDPDGQCRKGCIQTIDKWKAKLKYTDENDFIRQFAEIYAPRKSHPLNHNWPKNVLFYYKKSY